MGALAGYAWRKTITLSRSAGAVTNYQMKLLVGESAGATGENVDCGGHILSDFSDLRFTKADGTTELSYWIESITGSAPNRLATVWIMFDSIGTGATTFYMYYGKASASLVSNQIMTQMFQLREHKYYASYSPAMTWANDGPGALKATSSNSSLGIPWTFIVVPRDWINGKYLRFQWSGYHSYTTPKSFYCRIYDGALLRSSNTDFAEATFPSNSLLQTIVETSATDFGVDTVDVQVSVTGSGGYVTIAWYYIDGWALQNFWISIAVVEVNTSSGGSGNLVTLDCDDSVVMEVTGGTGDYGLYRNYNATEPAWGSWGGETWMGSFCGLVAPSSAAGIANPTVSQVVGV